MKVKDFSEIRIGHPFRKRLTNVPDGKVMVVQPRNIMPEGLIFEHNKPLRTDVPISKSLKSGDILVASRGRFAATVFNLSDDKIWITLSSVLVLSVFDQLVLPEYVALYFNSGAGQTMFRRHLEQTTIPFVSGKNLGDMNIPIPPLDRQKELITFEQSAITYARLSNRKQELLKKVLNYELSMTNGKEIQS